MAVLVKLFVWGTKEGRTVQILPNDWGLKNAEEEQTLRVTRNRVSFRLGFVSLSITARAVLSLHSGLFKSEKITKRPITYSRTPQAKDFFTPQSASPITLGS